jgi:hypothetical protein
MESVHATSKRKFRIPSLSDQGPRRFRIADYGVSPESPPAGWMNRQALRAVVEVGCWFCAVSILGLSGTACWSSPEFHP